MPALRITQVRSSIGARWRQRESLRTLGLRRIRHSVVREDSPQVRGLIAVVNHLVVVEPVTSGGPEQKTTSGGPEQKTTSGGPEQKTKGGKK
jgi:large subunit ribosomal protein L30